MASLWIGNINDSTTEDELRTFLEKYGFPPFDSLQMMEGTGTRPAALVTFNEVHAPVLRSLQPRIDKVFWKDRTIEVQVAPEHGT
jgi:RNA recognition motif-containing protein